MADGRPHRASRWWAVGLWLALALIPGCNAPPSDGAAEPAKTSRQEGNPGFARVLAPRAFAFPQDHGAHPDFRDEWWYVTGNLDGADGRRFGFQVTFFRHGLTAHPVRRPSHWAADQVYMAHFALTDAASQRFMAFERRARGGAIGLAGAQLAPFKVWLEDWRMEAEQGDDFPWNLVAREGDEALRLVLRAEKPLVLQGKDGLSQKSAEAGNASYYYSGTRLRAEGMVEAGGQTFPVQGNAWLDREWGTSALAPYQEGWDWFALQFRDGTELMFYQLRQKNGRIDPHSSGSWIDRNGVKTPLAHDDVELAILDQWQAPGGFRYPGRWRITVKPLHKTFLVRPILADQELRVSLRYWEGAVDVSDAGQPDIAVGRGYIEMTGYARKEEYGAAGKAALFPIEPP